MIYCWKCVLTINQVPLRQRGGHKTQISASWKEVEFWYEYSVTMNILKTKYLVAVLSQFDTL